MRRRIELFGLLALSLTAAASSSAEAPLAVAPEVRGESLSRLQGSASLGRNRPVSGATILVREVAGDGPVFVTSSDHRGLFVADRLADGRYRVELRRDGLESVVKESVDLRFPARPVVEVIMTPRAAADLSPPRPQTLAKETGELSLSGSVEARNGGALPAAELRLQRLDGSRDPIRVRSNEDGSFLIPGFVGGAWQLEAHVPGFLSVRTPLIVEADTELRISLVAQSAGYKPSPLELMPRERVVPPESLR